MAAPYWGQLPGPKIVRAQRISEESSLDAPPLTSHNRRASVQTALTDSPFSPSFESPVPSSIVAQGLAPRPASYQRPPAPTDQTSARARHRAKIARADDFSDEEPISPDISIAPDTSRGPPLGFGQPYSKGPSHVQTSPRGDSRSREPASPIRKKMDYKEEEYEQEPNGHNLTAQADDSQFPQESAEILTRKNGGGSQRRKGALPKSPLQRLEMTLDTMTKEEKRARVEAAERRARERYALKAGGAAQPASSRSRKQSVSRDVPRLDPVAVPSAPSREVPSSRESSVRKEAPQNQPQQRHQSHGELRSNGPSITQQWGNAQSAHHQDPGPGHPKRNLSFRERAARDDVDIPQHDVEDAYVERPYTHKESAQAQVPVSSSVARNGSSRSKANPPRDNQRHPRDDGFSQTASSGPSSHHHSAAQPSRTRDHNRRQSIDTRDRAIYQPEAAGDYPQGLQRRATEPGHGKQRAEPDLAARPVTRSNTVRQDVAPRHHGEGASAQRSQQESYLPVPVAGSTSQTQINRESMHPGEGLYKSPVWLDEWKKATVGLLAGSMLKLSKDQISHDIPASSDRNKAWWENSGHRKTSSYSGRQRRAEAFEGEYDNNDCKSLINSFFPNQL